MHQRQVMAQVLERGELFFFYRPRVGVLTVRALEDVARLYMVIRPRDRDIYRRVIIGRKRFPEIEEHGRHWALVDRVESEPEPIVEELREQPIARPAGEAVYAIVDHEGHRHLAYLLELPREPGNVQFTLRIEQEASYIVTVTLHDGRLAPLDPALLDVPGTELALIAASVDLRRELGLVVDVAHESATEAAIFNDLALDTRDHPIEPLIHGKWA